MSDKIKRVKRIDNVKNDSMAKSLEDSTQRFQQRVLWLLAQRGQSKVWLAKQIGMSKQAVHYLLTQSNAPKYVDEIAGALGVRNEWLNSGQGAMTEVEHQRAALVNLTVFSISELNSDMVMLMGNDSGSGSGSGSGTGTGSSTVVADTVTNKASTSSVQFKIQLTQKQSKLPQFTIHFNKPDIDAQYFAVELDNPTMEPVFNQGSILIFRRDDAAQSRDFVLVENEKQSTLFRQYVVDGKDIYYRPLNNEYKTLSSRQAAILGVLVESRIMIQ